MKYTELERKIQDKKIKSNEELSKSSGIDPEALKEIRNKERKPTVIEICGLMVALEMTEAEVKHIFK